MYRFAWIAAAFLLAGCKVTGGLYAEHTDRFTGIHTTAKVEFSPDNATLPAKAKP